MRKQQFIDALIMAGWEANHDAQHDGIERLWAEMFPVVAQLEYELELAQSESKDLVAISERT